MLPPCPLNDEPDVIDTFPEGPAFEYPVFNVKSPLIPCEPEFDDDISMFPLDPFSLTPLDATILPAIPADALPPVKAISPAISETDSPLLKPPESIT